LQQEAYKIFYRATHIQCMWTARYMLWPGVCLCVHHKPVFYRTGEWIKLNFDEESTFGLSYTVLLWQFRHIEKLHTHFWSAVSNSELGRFFCVFAIARRPLQEL